MIKVEATLGRLEKNETSNTGGLDLMKTVCDSIT